MMDHDEVPLDSGDVDIARCVRALLKAEYDGLIIPEHLGPQSIPDAVAYLKGLINS
jgi:sugar phosphate isomerase/epimerase